jgi:oxygen-independent coproporphyrinogen-3 oxidase
MLMSGKKDVSLYIHVPFCTHKCPYCHFYSVIDDEGLKNQYVNALCQEIERWRDTIFQREIVSVYFGGGTPFLLGPTRLERLMNLFPLQNSTEITIEANPETTTPSLLLAYRALGVNRLSIGAQSFSDQYLKTLHRAHSSDQTRKVLDEALTAGWNNISIDLMFDLPGMELSTWENTLEEACHLPIQHISLYNLVIEPKTAWFRNKEAIQSLMPKEEVSTQMIQSAWTITQSHGFAQYEISAFAKDGFYSRHNVGYWQGREFLGFGPSAFSFFGNSRFSNIANLKKYCQAIEQNTTTVETSEEIAPQQRLREMVAVGLRMNNGISLSSLEERWGPANQELTSTLHRLVSLELLEQHHDTFRLTNRGRLVYDAIAVEII